MAELCTERGYRASTIAHVTARARVSRRTIYEHFANREQIFLALLDRAIAELLAAAEASSGSAALDPLTRIEAALAAILAWVVEQPTPAWICLIEAQRATPQSVRRYYEAISRLTALLRRTTPPNPARPETLEEAVVGAIASTLRRLIRSGEAERAPELLPELSALLLTPYFFANTKGQAL
jgi:AcrR family transcriptional regulator